MVSIPKGTRTVWYQACRPHPTRRQDEMTRTLKEMPGPSRRTFKEMWHYLTINFDHTPDGKLLTNWRRVVPNKGAKGKSLMRIGGASLRSSRWLY